MTHRINLSYRGRDANVVPEDQAIEVVEEIFGERAAIVTVSDMRPVERAKHYIEIVRPVATIPDLQLFAIKWVMIGDMIGVYGKAFNEAQYRYYITQNYTSALCGDTMQYTKIQQISSGGLGWLNQVYEERRSLVEPNFIIPFSQVYADLSEQMSGVLENDPQSPLGGFVQRHLGSGGGSSGGGWATSR